jgi:phage FluMu protein Com
MSERKVLNKYYPPEFDPTRIPKSKRKGGGQWKVSPCPPCCGEESDGVPLQIHNMLPFTVRCAKCGNFMFEGTKFNTPMERAGDYLGVAIYRFYYRCPECSSEFTLVTDPENETYAVEQGATKPYSFAGQGSRELREAATAGVAALAQEDSRRRGEPGAPVSVASDAAGMDHGALESLESRAEATRRQLQAEEAIEALLDRQRHTASLTTEQVMAALHSMDNGRSDTTDEGALDASVAAEVDAEVDAVFEPAPGDIGSADIVEAPSRPAHAGLADSAHAANSLTTGLLSGLRRVKRLREEEGGGALAEEVGPPQAKRAQASDLLGDYGSSSDDDDSDGPQ